MFLFYSVFYLYSAAACQLLLNEYVMLCVISHEDYKNCLFTGEKQMRTMNIIRSDLHEMYSEEVNKVALSSKDDKRHVLPNKIDTVALGHYRLRR